MMMMFGMCEELESVFLYGARQGEYWCLVVKREEDVLA
jgi:hypothetical protein